MKAVILAAGSGRRLGIDKPKGLLNIYGKKLIDYSIDNLKAAGILNIVLCTGYKSEKYVEHFNNPQNGRRVVFPVNNPEFANCGSLYSLKIALESIDQYEDIVILDSDIIYNVPEFKHFIKHGAVNSVLCTDVPVGRYDACYVKMDMHQLLEAISKNQNYAKEFNSKFYEYIGITKISKNQIQHIIDYANNLFDETGSIDHEYDYVFENLEIPFTCEIYDNYIWTEADDDIQLQNLVTTVYPKLEL
jgi:choline kinase